MKSVKQILAKAREALRQRIRFKITRGGGLFILAIVVVGLAAIGSGNNLLFLVLAAMLSTLLVSGFVSKLCLAGLQLDFLVSEHIPAGRSVPGKLYVRNQKWLMPSFSIRIEGIRRPGGPTLKSGVYFPLIVSGATLEQTVEVRFPTRGAYRENGFVFLTSFPFGFLEKSARVTLGREMIVYPSVDPWPGFDDLLAGIAGEIESHYRGLGRDFYRIRPYEALESARRLDWKASAHTGALQVREFAREQERTVEMFLDRNIPPRFDARFEPWFEHAVNCCAFLAWSLSNQGASIHFRSNGYELSQPEECDIYTILKFLALVKPQKTTGPEGPLDETSYKVVFTPSPRQFSEAGWMDARILDPDALSLPAGPQPTE